jgi:hypothetical protein
VLIVSNYSISSYPLGRFVHTFTPENTATVYQFLANREAVLEQGERYNIGYEVIDGVNWVELSATSKADEVDPVVSHYVARHLGEQCRAVQTEKSNARVIHSGTAGAYLGKKYAWRIYGMAVARDTFDKYMEIIGHPMVSCSTEGSRSTAYLDIGIDSAVQDLINSCVKVGNTGNRFSSPLLPSKPWFQVKGIAAITDKK